MNADWSGEAVFILAGGPSVLALDLSLLKARRVIAINSAYESYPQADACFFADGRWHSEVYPKRPPFAGLFVTTSACRNAERFTKTDPSRGIAVRPDHLALSRTSVSGAANYARHKGASAIVLVGVDGQINGRRHHHGAKYPWALKGGCFDEHRAELAAIAPSLRAEGIRPINCSPSNVIPGWESMSFKEATAMNEPSGHVAPKRKKEFLPLVCRSGRAPSQRADELRPFIALLKREKVRSYLEIGARHGDTFFEVMTSLPKGSVGVAVDLAGGPWGTPKSRPALIDAVAELKAMGYDARIVWGDSRSAGVRQAVMLGGPYDAALIDGDHRLAGVTADWEAYGPMARMVAFHDIVGRGQTTRSRDKLPVEVPDLWAKLKAGNKVREFIGDGSPMRIGVIFNSGKTAAA